MGGWESWRATENYLEICSKYPPKRRTKNFDLPESFAASQCEMHVLQIISPRNLIIGWKTLFGVYLRNRFELNIS